jgi:hypothetical protein
LKYGWLLLGTLDEELPAAQILRAPWGMMSARARPLLLLLPLLLRGSEKARGGSSVACD